MSETDYKTHAIALILSELQTFGVFGYAWHCHVYPTKLIGIKWKGKKLDEANIFYSCGRRGYQYHPLTFPHRIPYLPDRLYFSLSDKL